MTETKKRVAKAFGILAGAAALVLFVGLIWQPSCPIIHFTGLYCAGCGFCRMLEAVLHGNFAAAFGLNPFLFVVFPLAAVYAVIEAVRYVQQKRPLFRSRLSVPAAAILIAVAVIFMIVRNLH